MEYFYTFLKPIVLSCKGTTYYVHGYCEVGEAVISFSATTDLTTPWTKAEAYIDKDLIAEFTKLLPEKPVKRRRRSTK